MNVIETCGLTKVYRGKRAVDRLDMHVAHGDIYGFVGKNGAGKSTAMKMICGLALPTSGEVRLFGQVGTGGDPRIGALVESPGLLPNLTAYENLMAKALASGMPDAPARCAEMLELVGLGEAGRAKAKGFSLGMKQRLGLALALLGSPDVLLLDEPMNGLDPEGTRAMRTLLVRLNQTLGITVVVSSHVLDQLDRMASRFGVIADGTMVRELTAAELRAECGDSLRVKTADPARSLALLEEAFPRVSFRAEPDGALSASGPYDAAAVSWFLRDADQVVLELSVLERDIEDYFLDLMQGGGDRV